MRSPAYVSSLAPQTAKNRPNMAPQDPRRKCPAHVPGRDGALPAGGCGPRASPSTRDVPAHTARPAGSLGCPRFAREAPRCAGGARRRGAPWRRRHPEIAYKNLVRDLCGGRRRTFCGSFGMPRGALDAQRVGAFGEPAGGAPRAQSCPGRPKPAGGPQAIWRLPTTSGTAPARYGAGTRVGPVSGQFCVFFLPLCSCLPYMHPATGDDGPSPPAVDFPAARP